MINIFATDEWRIVVPVRFQRFNHGAQPALDSPEIDDRGYAKGTRPAPWGDTAVRGPSFGVTVNDTVSVRLLREDIDPGAPLVARSSDEKVLTIDSPAGIIEAAGALRVRGVSSGTARVEIRLGDHEGPILAEADVRVHSRLRVALTPHLVKIDSTTARGTVPSIDIARITRLVRAIWRPCGIDFDVRQAVSDTTQLPSNRADFMDDNVDNADRYLKEVQTVLGLQRARLNLPAGKQDESINWYVIQEFVPRDADHASAGMGVDKNTSKVYESDTGVISSARAFGEARDPESTARTLAHEIGHFFGLSHAHNRDADDPARDTFARRQLMYPSGRLREGLGGLAPPRFNNIGYGERVRGCLITMKNLPHHPTDGECATARNAIHSRSWM